jgi:phosphoribosylformylglycinamidine cyclo-ligase
VDIDVQDQALKIVAELVQSTATAGVAGEPGGFGGLFSGTFSGYRDPLLVASADGVGTKLMVASMAGDLETVGADLVNHCVNDILVQGAQPLFYLDYVGTSRLQGDELVQLIQGVARACKENGCALLGGETAEMPGVYTPGHHDLVGFIVGLVDRPHLLGGHRVEVGDRLLGLPSAGLHTNGYSLAREVFFQRLGLEIFDAVVDLPGRPTVAETLLSPHLSYLSCVAPLLQDGALHALAHITGGGLTDNLPRILPRGTCARIFRDSWEVPPVFSLIQEVGEVSADEMLRVFNMGVGLVAVVEPGAAHRLLQSIPGAWMVGLVEAGESGVRYC